MNRTDEDRALALAGVFDAVALVDQTAFRATPPPETVATALAPLFRFDAADVPSVYGGVGNLRRGLEVLARAFGGDPHPDDGPLVRYALALLHLEGVYAGDGGMQRELNSALRRIQLQGDAEGLGGAATVEALADAWTRTAGKIRPRIMVNGEPARLRDARHVALIRALLLAGLRSAVLWRQVGGSRWTLLFARGRLRRAAEGLLSG